MSITQQPKNPSFFSFPRLGLAISICYCSIAAVYAAETVDVNSADRLQLISEVTSFSHELVEQHYPEATAVRINVRSPDIRTSLSQCLGGRLSLHGSQTVGSRILIKVECADNRSHHLAVDVAVEKPIVVARSALARQTMLTPAQLTMGNVNILTNRRVFVSSIDDAIGKRLKRAVSAGTKITQGMLLEPSVVNRGDSVVIVASKGSLVVKMPGTAMATGSKGQQIAVKNESSKRVVKGWIRGPGEVHVPL